MFLIQQQFPLRKVNGGVYFIESFRFIYQWLFKILQTKKYFISKEYYKLKIFILQQSFIIKNFQLINKIKINHYNPKVKISILQQIQLQKRLNFLKKLKQQFLNQQKYMQSQQNQEIPNNIEQEDPDMPDDDIPDLWKKSSLRQRTDPILKPLILDVYNIKKFKNQNGNLVINDYVVKQELGRGAFGQVLKATKQNKDYAIKVYNMFKLQKNRFFAPDGDFANGLDMLDNQLNIIKRLSHPNLPRFDQILHTSQTIYLVHQLCNMGQIMKWDSLKQNYVRNKKVVQYIQTKYGATQLYDVTRIVFAQVCSAVKYLHDNNITNRDIKVDNILCTQTPNNLQEVKLTDFTTIRYSKDDISYFASGTPGFRGPQHQFASQQGYSTKASDIWSIGISIYTFYYQNFPFYGQTELDVDIKAKNNPLEFDETCPNWLKQLIQRMSQKQWKNRITIDQALKILTLK